MGMITAYRVFAVAGTVVALLLQVLLAPHIALFSAVPDFLLVLAAAAAVLYADEAGPVLPFIAGLAFDLVSGGPVGAMAFTLCALSVAASWFFRRANNDTLFMALVTLAALVLLVEFSYGMFLLLFGYAANLLEALAYRIVPCFLYDLVIAMIVYLVAARLLVKGDPLQAEISQLH